MFIVYKVCKIPAGTQRCNNVDSALIQRRRLINIESMVFQRCVPDEMYVFKSKHVKYNLFCPLLKMDLLYKVFVARDSFLPGHMMLVP